MYDLMKAISIFSHYQLGAGSKMMSAGRNTGLVLTKKHTGLPSGGAIFHAST